MRHYLKIAFMGGNIMGKYGYDLLLGSIAAFYVFTVPFTKVEESFNMQAMHDIIYHRHQLHKYDHLEFPGVVPRTFIGAWIVSVLASPVVSIFGVLGLDKYYSLLVVRLVLGCITLYTLRFFRTQIRNKFGHQTEAFFVILTAIQFHTLFYSTRPLPNTLAAALVNMSYGYWLQGRFYIALQFLIVATIVFRCDMLLLLGPIGLELLLTRSISLMKAIKYSLSTAIFSIGLSMLIDSYMWKRTLWPEFEVFWFNSVLNRSSEWGVHPFHWYFTSALPRALLVAYPLSVVGLLLDRRILPYFLPALMFLILYSKLPHKELRFIIGSVPMFNLSAAVAASRIYINRKKSYWRRLFCVFLLGLLLISLGCTIIFYMASYENYPSGNALERLHQTGNINKNTDEIWVHIDTFSAINGITRFCEHNQPWRYSKEEGLALKDLRQRNFTYLLNEHSTIDGYRCLFFVDGFSRMRLHNGIPPFQMIKEPKVYVHGAINSHHVTSQSWPGCTRDH
ncbi:hypothetical protein V2J09_020852 [Rumex salicifolius]